jgi:hypothetical protein
MNLFSKIALPASATVPTPVKAPAPAPQPKTVPHDAV